MIDLHPALNSAESWQNYATQVRAVNAGNGWGITFIFDDVPGYLALIHSEISEANNETDFPAIAGELVDVVIRALDLMELLGSEQLTGLAVGARSRYMPDISPTGPLERCEEMLNLHAECSKALESYRKTPDITECRRQIHGRLALIATLAYRFAADLADGREKVDALLWAKLDKNRTRGYRHGGLRT